jgi:ATP-binding cassette subfamily B protein
LGQRQRILLARALVGKPQLLILDEAFSGMDEMTKLKVIDKLFDSSKPWTILNISHDPEVVIKTNHIFLLEDGRIIEAGLLDQLRANSGSEFIRLFPKLIL